MLLFDYFKKTVTQLKSNNSNSLRTKNTIFLLALSELFIVIVGIFLSLYIDRLNSSRNFLLMENFFDHHKLNLKMQK